MSLKRIIKTVVGGACAAPLFRPWVQRTARNSINVAYYHQVGEPAPHYRAFYSGCKVTKFARDLAQLSRVFDFVPLADVLSADHRVTHHRPTLAITFDDGLDLGQQGILEILERYKIKATTFVITSCIGNQRLMWRHALSAIQCLADETVLVEEYNDIARNAGIAPLVRKRDLMSASRQWDMDHKDIWVAELWQRCHLVPITEYLSERKPYFNWEQLRQWTAAGHSVGFHTHTHPYCSRLRREDLEPELICPARQLKQDLGISGLSLSYPFGDRLQPILERELFASGLFQALWGIGGSRPIGTSFDSLERYGAEADSIGWSIFADQLQRTFSRVCQPSMK